MPPLARGIRSAIALSFSGAGWPGLASRTKRDVCHCFGVLGEAVQGANQPSLRTACPKADKQWHGQRGGTPQTGDGWPGLPSRTGNSKVSARNGTAACRARVYGGHRGRAISAVLIFGGLVSVDSWEAGVAGVGAHGETSPVRGRGEAGVSVAGVSVAGGVAVTLATVGRRSSGLGRRSGVR